MLLILTYSHCSPEYFDFLWFQYFFLKTLRYMKMDIIYLYINDWHYIFSNFVNSIRIY